MTLKDFCANYSFKKIHILYAAICILLVYIASSFINCTDYAMRPGSEPSPTAADNSKFTYDLPLDPGSPWPKFRCNALQNGRSEVIPEKSGLRPWVYETGKGIFSSPVVDGDGTVYIGSADHYFYAIDKTGKLKWRRLTGEIIDSSALLDDKSRVYVGSGDGHVYAFDRAKGTLLWKFKAHSPQEVKDKFDLKTYNLNWFEGNIGILLDGTILAPNDNYLVYALDRETGTGKTQYLANEMVWSLPAVNTKTGRIFFGTCFAALKNVFCYNSDSAAEQWTSGGLGTNAATIMLTSESPSGAALVGGFDGMLRAYAQKNGSALWKFGTRGHIYASPAQLKDGTVIQPSADGTVYAINPDDGSLKWAFDTREPIRSSPAVDANDVIYVGSGEGRLFCINPDGTLRWAYRCIDDDRNDLNASPALGRQGVYIAGESGGIFFIPYVYPLSMAGKTDERCTLGPGEDLPKDGDFLFFTTRFGGLQIEAPKEIDANEPLAFSLSVRKNGDTVLAAIDGNSLNVTFTGGTEGRVKVSADRQFITIIPGETWTGPEGGTLTIRLKGPYITGLSRFGLKFFGGSRSGEFDRTFSFRVRPRKSGTMPYRVPAKTGDPATVFEMSRLAAPSPAILPSWNQIGFDSLHYLYGIVEGKGSNAIIWSIRGKLDGISGKTIADTSLQDRFPLILNYDRGLVTMYNYDGFLLDFNGTWDMPYALYRLAVKANPATGAISGRPALNAIARCDEIKFYGKFLKLTGMSEFDTGLMTIYGGCDLKLHGKGYTTGPGNTGTVSFHAEKEYVSAKISGSQLKKGEHVYGILLVDTATNKPVQANYARKTFIESHEDGTISTVKLQLEEKGFPVKARAYFMVDTYPAVKAELIIEPQ